MLTNGNKKYSNEHPKGKKPTEEENIKVAKKDKFTIKIDPMEFKIIDLAKTIIKLTNSKSNIVNKKLPTDDPIRRKPNISLAKNVLDWEPSFNLEEGLKLTIDYFKSQIK